MADIYHDFPIRASADRVFDAISSPEGLSVWWTRRATGEPVKDSTYELFFGPGYDWRAKVRSCTPGSEITWEFTSAEPEWVGSVLRFELRESGGVTQVRFSHTGWPDAGKHFRTSSYCWAMYLRLLRRYVEHGEIIPYDERLDV